MTFGFKRQPEAALPFPPVRHTNARLDVDAYAIGHIGKRMSNEDAYLCLVDLPAPEWLTCLMVVADGIGGKRNGSIASQLAVRAVSETVLQSTDVFSHRFVLDLMQQCFSNANRAVYNASLDDAALAEMGTTLVVGMIAHRRLYLASLGDSRAYLHRGRRFIQLTEDDWYQVVGGSEEAAEFAPGANVTMVTSAIGWKEDPSPQILDYEIGLDDNILLCSDGLTNTVPDRTIEQTLFKYKSRIDVAARKLLDEAISAPDADNTSIVIARIIRR